LRFGKGKYLSCYIEDTRLVSKREKKKKGGGARKWGKKTERAQNNNLGYEKEGKRERRVAPPFPSEKTQSAFFAKKYYNRHEREKEKGGGKGTGPNRMPTGRMDVLGQEGPLSTREGIQRCQKEKGGEKKKRCGWGARGGGREGRGLRGYRGGL